jgi:protein-S-isoprenylcysteine O-methyltransferase Ste14
VSGRGGGWVVAQFALIALCLVAVVIPPEWPSAARVPLAAVGAVLALAGATVAVMASRTLGRGLTAYPRPVAGAPLVESGPYRIVRHPIYSGALLFFTGWSLFAGPVALAITAALGILWVGKTAVEERYLRDAHREYAAYASRVRRRLVPGVY